MRTEQLIGIIEGAWEARDNVTLETTGELRDAVHAALAGLDDGTYRVLASTSPLPVTRRAPAYSSG